MTRKEALAHFGGRSYIPRPREIFASKGAFVHRLLCIGHRPAEVEGAAKWWGYRANIEAARTARISA